MPEFFDFSIKINQFDPGYELNKEALRAASKFAA